MRALILILILSGCASSQLIQQYRGVEVEGDVPYRTVVQISTFLLSKIGKLDRFEELMRWDYRFVNTWIVTRNEETGEVVLGDGYTDFKTKTILVYKWQPCLAASSLLHEMVHALGYKHEDKLMWYNVPIIHGEAINKFCGKDYEIPKPPTLTKEEIEELLRGK